MKRSVILFAFYVMMIILFLVMAIQSWIYLAYSSTLLQMIRNFWASQISVFGIGLVAGYLVYSVIFHNELEQLLQTFTFRRPWKKQKEVPAE